jgi:hypothetical protein
MLEAGYPDFLALKDLQPLQPPTALTLPTFFEMAQQDAKEIQQQTSAPSGSLFGKQSLFTALVGDPKILLREYLEDPRRFDAATAELIQQLSHGTRLLSDLSPEELQLLDLATIEYASPRHSQKQFDNNKLDSQPHSAVEHLTHQELMSDDDVELEYREDGKHVPLTNVPDIPMDAPSTMWWQK